MGRMDCALLRLFFWACLDEHLTCEIVVRFFSFFDEHSLVQIVWFKEFAHWKQSDLWKCVSKFLAL